MNVEYIALLGKCKFPKIKLTVENSIGAKVKEFDTLLKLKNYLARYKNCSTIMISSDITNDKEETLLIFEKYIEKIPTYQ